MHALLVAHRGDLSEEELRNPRQVESKLIGHVHSYALKPLKKIAVLNECNSGELPFVVVEP
jgi:hypothetical protein